MSFYTKLDLQYKLLFLGDTSVGKTSLLIRYIDNKYDGDGLPTLGVDVRYKFVELENKKIRVDIWDTAGQERFKNITKNYFRGAHGIILVFDITNRATFDVLKTWFITAQNNVSPETEMIVVGNKIDLNDERQVNFESLKEFGLKHKIDVFETSAKTGEGVQEIFECLINKLFMNKNIGIISPTDDENSKRNDSHVLDIESQRPREKKKDCNC
jgi:small GTP-binding protein